jgi:HD-like signal output (HDOD) protein
MDDAFSKENLDLRKIITEFDNLPTMPVVAQQLVSISEWDNVDLNEVADIISKDISLSSWVLRVVNSPMYGFAQRVSTISHALVLLGLNPTRSLALSFCLPKLSEGKRRKGFNYQGFWTRSLNTAVAARELALFSGLVDKEETFLTGLLQDIGVMVIAQCVPETYLSLLGRGKYELAPSVKTEKENLGIDHVGVAKVLFEKWDLPASLRIPVLFHHDPDKAVRLFCQFESSTLPAALASGCMNPVPEILPYPNSRKLGCNI